MGRGFSIWMNSRFGGVGYHPNGVLNISPEKIKGHTQMGVPLNWWTRGDSVPDHLVVSMEPPPSSRRRSTPRRGVELNCSNLPGKKLRDTPIGVYLLIGGPEEIRTPDPYNANVMRSQLRYGPVAS